jgi:hypothetical protein
MIILGVLLASFLITAKESSAQVYHTPPTEKINKQCYFCGKDIWKIMEIKYGNDSDYGFALDWRYDLLTMVPDSNKIYTISIKYMLEVCEKCYMKYNKSIEAKMQYEWVYTTDKISIKTKTLRQHYKRLREKKETAALKKKIKELEEQLKKMKSEVKNE